MNKFRGILAGFTAVLIVFALTSPQPVIAATGDPVYVGSANADSTVFAEGSIPGKDFTNPLRYEGIIDHTYHNNTSRADGFHYFETVVDDSTDAASTAETGAGYFRHNKRAGSNGTYTINGLEGVAASYYADEGGTFRGVYGRTYTAPGATASMRTAVGGEFSARASYAGGDSVVAESGTAFIGSRIWMAPYFTYASMANINNFWGLWIYGEHASYRNGDAAIKIGTAGGGFTVDLNLQNGETISNATNGQIDFVGDIGMTGRIGLGRGTLPNTKTVLGIWPTAAQGDTAWSVRSSLGNTVALTDTTGKGTFLGGLVTGNAAYSFLGYMQNATGTPTAPAYGFYYDTDTGLYSSGGLHNRLVLGAGGIRVGSADSLGIHGYPGLDARMSFHSDVTDSALTVTLPLGVPTISGFATDGDTSTITWNTSDQEVHTGATGGYIFDEPINGATVTPQEIYIATGQMLSLDPNWVGLWGFITPATTEQDLSPHNHDLTYNNFLAADQGYFGRVYSLSFYAGSNEYLNTADHNDFTFDDTASGGFTMNFNAQVVATDSVQTLISKWDETAAAEAREWRIHLDATEKVVVSIFDESANVGCTRTSDAAVAAGFHQITAVYDGSGGATAANGIVIYIDGAAVASTAANDGSYVGMENLTAPVYVGAIENDAGVNCYHFQGDMTVAEVTTTEMTADQVWQLYGGYRGYVYE